MHITYPANFHQLSDHDNAETIFLPHHPPKIIQCLLLGSLWEERGNNRERDKKEMAASKSVHSIKGVFAVVKSLIIVTFLRQQGTDLSRLCSQ